MMMACLSAGGVARAQSEAKTWYVPWTWSVGAGEDPSSITVTNLNSQVVRVNVRAFDKQGVVLSAASAAFSLQPAASSYMPFPVKSGGPVAMASFVLVLADQPVLVRARAATVITPVMEKDCKPIASRGSPNGEVLFCEGQLGSYDSNGKFQFHRLSLWKYWALQEWPAYPIDCSASAPTHFACSQRIAHSFPGGDVSAPVDGVNREADPGR
jgi:hypothetical protein